MAKRFEYHFMALDCYDNPAERTAMLNELGNEGWEVIGTLPGHFGYDDCTIGFVLFKRESSKSGV